MQTPFSPPPRSPLRLRRLGLAGWIGLGLVVILIGVTAYFAAPAPPHPTAQHAQVQH